MSALSEPVDNASQVETETSTASRAGVEDTESPQHVSRSPPQRRRASAVPPVSNVPPQQREAPVSELVRHTHHLLAVLAAVSAFGANMAFVTLQSATAQGRAYTAWAFAAFALGILVTLLWQAVIMTDVRRFTSSTAGVLAAPATGCMFLAVGTLLLSLSMTRHALPSVRVAGYTLVAMIISLLGVSFVYLGCKVLRPAHRDVGTPETVILHWFYNKSCAAELETLNEIVHHALRKNLRLSISLTFRRDGDPGPEGNTSRSQTPYEEVFSLIHVALPILVSLYLSVSDRMVSRLEDFLCRPAENLQDLWLVFATSGSMPIPEVPVGLFAGTSPKLRRVALHDLRVGRDPIPAFATLTSVHLEYNWSCPEVVFGRHFPNLRSLSLAFFRTSDVPPAVPFNFDGVRLDRLSIDDSTPPVVMSAITNAYKDGDIPIVESVCASAQWTDPVWQRRNDGPLSIRLRSYLTAAYDVTILLVPEHRRWYRTYHVYNWRPDWPFPIAGVPRLAERLTYLRMDNLYLIGFLECKLIAFDVLRELQIDLHSGAAHGAMVWPPDWLAALGPGDFSFGRQDKSAPTFERESFCHVDCRALTTVRLFAASKEISVASQEAAFLGRALAQCPRPPQDRASLELHGVNFHQPVSRALLAQTFSAVREYEGSGWNSPADKDSGLWDRR
ncbi:hypothetical protein AURDEDRAFT_182655 [Auricularia subglabra TFB-10046 SS5]|nr:hypothetical protein AURDEDRAFT_182655 [Auricularia subglabra TFB-10046 SS5]